LGGAMDAPRLIMRSVYEAQLEGKIVSRTLHSRVATRIDYRLWPGWRQLGPINLLRNQPEIKGFWAGPGPVPRPGRPRPCPGGISAPLPGTRIPGGRESGAHTSHAPGTGPPHRGPVRFPAAVACTAVGCLDPLSLFGGPIMIKPIRSKSVRNERDAPKSPMTGPTPRLRPAQAAPVRRGQSAGGEGIPGGVDGWWDGCVPAIGSYTRGLSGSGPFAGGDED
jgi:hypothetical protein